MNWSKRTNSKAAAEFDFFREVGRGSYGVVEKVCRKRDGQVCVMKTVLLEHLGSERERTMALNEAKIMRELTCPHIVEYLDAFTDQGALCLVLEFCELGSLKDLYLRSSNAISTATIWRIAIRMTLGLEYLHSRRILHRDVKSENILLRAGDVVKIADLGLAKQLSQGANMASTLCGTPKYLAPEMALCVGSYSNKCDVWSLGVILYEMCSDGHIGPFVAASLPELLLRIQHQEVRRLPWRTDERLRGLVLRRLLAKEPSQRPTASEVLALPEVRCAGRLHRVAELAARTAEAAPCKGSAPDKSADHVTAPSEHSREIAQVPDSPCTVIGRWFGLGLLETSLGPRFNRLSCCELCAAQGLPGSRFTVWHRRHHCRNCGRSVCSEHCTQRWSLPHFGYTAPQRVCDLCSLVPGAVGRKLVKIEGKAWPWIVAVGHGSPAIGWDSQALHAAAWTSDAKLLWAGCGSTDRGPAICTLNSRADARLEQRVLETGRVEGSVDLPLEIGKAAIAETPQNLSGGGASNFSTLRSQNSLFSRAAEIDVAACCCEWFAVAQHDWQSSTVYVVGLPKSAILGYCQMQERVTALAVQDGPQGFVTGGLQNGEVRVWDVPGSEEPCPLRCVLHGHKQAVTCMAVAGTSSIICSGSSGGLRLWRRQGSGSFAENRYPTHCMDLVASGSGAVCCAASMLAFVRRPKQGTWEKGVALWDLGIGRFERCFFQKGHSASCVALCGSLLATSGPMRRGGCLVQLWYVHTGTPLAVFKNPCPINQLLIVDALTGKGGSEGYRLG